MRDEQNTVPEEHEGTEEETESVLFADRVADGQGTAYNIETSVYEEGSVHVEYPQLTGMADEERQKQINDNIKRVVMGSIATENLRSYEMQYETASKGSGMVSFIFRGFQVMRTVRIQTML